MDKEVAWMNDSGGCFLSDGNKYSENWMPLYTSPPKREPLSDEEINAITLPEKQCTLRELVRLIEKAHGIGVDNE